jgi:L,D-transpeptidase ErfK/SrfK
MRQVIVICLLMIAAVPARAQERTVTMIGGSSTYVVAAGDTLAGIAARFGVTVATIVERNHLARPNDIRPGQALVVEARHLVIVEPGAALTINVPQRMLAFAGAEGVSAFPVTVGQRTWPTPLGAFSVTEKKSNPVWHVPLSIQREMEQQGKPVIKRMEPSDDNPLGAHWLRLSIPGLGIHGTNAPSSIYRYASHGCIRMHPDAIAWLFERVAVGATGVLIYEPIVADVIDGRVWIEAHPDPYRRAPDGTQRLREMADQRAFADRIDWSKAAVVLRERTGRPEDITAADTDR